MINSIKRNSKYSLLSLLLLFASCDPQLVDEIPFVIVEIDINLNNTEYLDLNREGGYVYILGGVRGIILYRAGTEEYRAFERNSPINALDACSIIDVDDSGLFMVDPCHNVFFDFDGRPISGNSFPMRQYQTILDGNWLYIRNGTI